VAEAHAVENDVSDGRRECPPAAHGRLGEAMDDDFEQRYEAAYQRVVVAGTALHHAWARRIADLASLDAAISEHDVAGQELAMLRDEQMRRARQ